MWKVTLKGLFAHRVRLALTTLSVVLGVAFVAGTLVLTDTMGSVFDDLVRGSTGTFDVLVRGGGPSDGDAVEEFDLAPPPLPERLVDDVLALDGVAGAEGVVEGYALIVRPDGEPITPRGPPSLGAAWSQEGGRTIQAGGRAPSAPDEVVVDATTADRNDLGVGDRVRVVFSSVPPRAFTVVGISTLPTGDDLAGATLAEFEPSLAKEVLDLEGRVTGINVWAIGGVEPEVLADRLQTAFPDLVAITAADWADEVMAGIDDALGFITRIFGVFAGIALFVGAFIIANTFSITVLQRTREFALLRSIGASRRQVLGGVVGEAVLIGLLASALGVLAGLGIATLLNTVLRVFGLDMPTGALVLRPRTVLVALTVGLVVTVLSSLLPARRAAATHPMAALRAAAGQAYRPSRTRRVGGAVAAALAAVLIVVGTAGGADGAAMVGAGAVLAMVGLSALGPSLTRPVLRLFGGSGARLGTVGRIARSNSLRTPRRTWTTAAALTIGLALVSSVAVIGASTKASTSVALDGTLRADAIVTASNAMTGGTVPPVLGRALADSADVGAVSPIRGGTGDLDGVSAAVLAVDPASWDAVAATVFSEGTLADLGDLGTVAVDADLAAEHGYRIGDLIPAVFPATGATDLTLVAVFEADAILSGWLVSTATHGQLFDHVTDASLLVVGVPGAAPGDALSAVQRLAEPYPAVLVQDQTQFRASFAVQIDQLLALVTALLGMALFIAVLGIMNTLALSIHERTREIGLLRAVGMTRGQVRGMVRWEAVTVALLGTFVGLLLGVLLGWATTRVLADDGMGTFALPLGQLGGAVALAAVAGIIAAVLPARSAANLDVLAAISAE